MTSGAASPTRPAAVPGIAEDAAIPLGFRAGGGMAGIKPSGRPDVALLLGEATAAAVFTPNRMPAAPVLLSRDHLEATGGHASAVIVTSGCANAATGEAGMGDQRAVAAAVAEAAGIPPEEVLAGSTGLIGTRLPVDRVREAVGRLVASGLTPTDTGLAAFGAAMMTTDSRAKSATTTLTLPAPDGGEVVARITGVAKGVGMIHPRMATLIAVVLTDVAATPAVLGPALRAAVAGTYDQMSVDGDMSTNDTVYLLASGAADARVEADTASAAIFADALERVLRSLARQHAADGEGARTLITCRATGARDLVDARAISRSVIASSLVKAAVHGRDPNWGRVAMAVGAAYRPDGAPAEVDPARLSIRVCGTPVFAGEPLPFDRAAVAAAMDAPEVLYEVELGLGDATADAWGCDLTEAYVVENSAYST